MIKAKIAFEFSGKKYAEKLADNLNRTILRGALMVENQTKQLLNQSGKSMPAKMGINQPKTAQARKKGIGIKPATRKQLGLYWYGEPLHRWVEASQRGTPPHKQTGTLQRSITHEREPQKLRAKIGPSQNLVYARRLELGDLDRPYLTPAFLSLEAKILKMLTETVKDAQP
jgi:hypothetical protein